MPVRDRPEHSDSLFSCHQSNIRLTWNSFNSCLRFTSSTPQFFWMKRRNDGDLRRGGPSFGKKNTEEDAVFQNRAAGQRNLRRLHAGDILVFFGEEEDCNVTKNDTSCAKRWLWLFFEKKSRCLAWKVFSENRNLNLMICPRSTLHILRGHLTWNKSEISLNYLHVGSQWRWRGIKGLRIEETFAIIMINLDQFLPGSYLKSFSSQTILISWRKRLGAARGWFGKW